MLLAMPDVAATVIETLVHKSRGARLKPIDEAAEILRFAVPRLAVRVANHLQLFDRAHFLDIPWKLEECDSESVLDFFQQPTRAVDEAHVDVDTAGKVTVEFVTELHEQLALALLERGWTKTALVNWLDRRLPFSTRRDITRVSSTLFIAKVLDTIGDKTGLSLEGLARAKFRLVEALVRVIGKHRDARETLAFERALFPQSGLEFETSSDIELVFDETRYSYNEPYKGGTEFKKHLFRVVGDLDAKGEEYECAVYLERNEQIKAWVRNTVKQPNSFWLQTSSDKFYPDFVALLKDGRYAVVEYKGADRWKDADHDRLVGNLWADRSHGKCIFVMLTNREFGVIDSAIGSVGKT